MRLLLPILADIGHGIFATLLAGFITDTTLSWHFVLGILFALLPDIDAVPRLVIAGTASQSEAFPKDHREYTHYPVMYVLIGFCICYFDLFFGLLFLFATMLHFLNDTWGVGHGLMWFRPFTSTKYKLHFDRFLQRFLPDPKPISSTDDNKWINESYLRLTPTALIEYGTFILALAALVFYFVV